MIVALPLQILYQNTGRNSIPAYSKHPRREDRNGSRSMSRSAEWPLPVSTSRLRHLAGHLWWRTHIAGKCNRRAAGSAKSTIQDSAGIEATHARSEPSGGVDQCDTAIT